MGTLERTGLDGVAITAISVGVGLITSGDPYSGGVAFAIGIGALVLSERVRLDDFSVDEETIESASEEAGEAIEDAADGRL